MCTTPPVLEAFSPPPPPKRRLQGFKEGTGVSGERPIGGPASDSNPLRRHAKPPPHPAPELVVMGKRGWVMPEKSVLCS